MPDTRIGPLLESLPELQSLNRELKKLAALQVVLQSFLPVALAKCTTVASVKAGMLTLHAVNHSAAAKLKQIAPRILMQMRSQRHDITGILVQMQVTNPAKPLPHKQISMGPQARTALDSLAERLDSSPLKSAVKRLRKR